MFPLLFTPAGSYLSYSPRAPTDILSETLVKIVYSSLWAIFVLRPIHRQAYTYVSLQNVPHIVLTKYLHRFPRTIPFVIMDFAERFYLAGFPLLQLFVTLFPLLTARRASSAGEGAESEGSALEFLPLMLTSVYCAVGLVWAFVRLSVMYLVSTD